jgi:hypothetical protein
MSIVKKSNHFLNLTTFSVRSDILKKLFQPEKCLSCLFVPYPGAMGRREGSCDLPAMLIPKKEQNPVFGCL